MATSHVIDPLAPAPPIPLYDMVIGGVAVNPLHATFQVQETIDTPDTLIANIESLAAPYFRPAIGQAAILTENGTRIFGGTVTGIRERGFSGPNGADIVVELQATSFQINAERRLITKAFNQTGEGDTIGSAFAALVAEYYAAVGVTLHPDQTPGPVLPMAVFERTKGDEVNRLIAASVGYIQAIDFENRLRAWAPGEVAAPYAYDETVNPDLLTGDIEVQRGQLQSGYANRVILTGDPLAIPDYRDSYVGDGVTNLWPVTYLVNGPLPNTPDGAVGNAIIFYPDLPTTENMESIGTVAALNLLWEYDTLAHTISRRAGPVPAGVRFEFPYHALFLPNAVAEDAAEIAQYGLWEHIEEVTAVTTGASAQAYAEALLAAKVAGKEEIITLYTRALGFHPGQVMTVTAPARALTGEYLITQVDTRAEDGGGLLRTITASKSLNNRHDWRRVYQQWAGVSAGGSSTATIAPSPGGGLHAPNHLPNGIDPIPNLALTNLPNPWSVGQTFPAITVTGSTRIGSNSAPLKTLHVGDGNEASALPSYPGLIVQSLNNVSMISARSSAGGGASLEGGFFAHPNGNFYLGTFTNHRISLRVNNLDIGSLELGDGASGVSTVSRLTVGRGDPTIAQTGQPGIVVSDVIGATITAKQTTNNVQIGMLAYAAGVGYFGTWTLHPLRLRMGNNDVAEFKTDQNFYVTNTTETWGLRVLTSYIYVGGFRVDVTANCSIPGAGGGVELPPYLAYTNLTQNWGGYQRFDNGISVLGIDWATYFNQPVRSDSGPSFASVNVSGAITGGRYWSGGLGGATQTIELRTALGGAVWLRVTNGIVTHFEGGAHPGGLTTDGPNH